MKKSYIYAAMYHSFWIRKYFLSEEGGLDIYQSKGLHIAYLLLILYRLFNFCRIDYQIGCVMCHMYLQLYIMVQNKYCWPLCILKTRADNLFTHLFIHNLFGEKLFLMKVIFTCRGFKCIYSFCPISATHFFV